ncbi:MAG: hypothetical protein OEM15_16855 [Myxococcales bacterium]|nr:hypothetical protein [Myxococcales bacterium]MDH3482772.1 hypothetical protein [Myxococcales bacterium]
MATIVPEEIDLNQLRRQLQGHFGELPPAGYVRGKTALRAAIVQILQCSELESEQLVDTLEARRMIRYEGEKRDAIDDLESFWQLAP